MIENYQTNDENENNQTFQQTPSNLSSSISPQTIIIRQEEKSTNGIGTAGFVMSLIAIFLGWIPVIGWIIWILGLVLSFVGIFKKPKGELEKKEIVALISYLQRLGTDIKTTEIKTASNN